jgi:hypothetical protein
MLQGTFAQARAGKVRVIEFYDAGNVVITAEPIWNTKVGGQNKRFEVLMQEKHDLGKCPVVLGTRPTPDGTYRGDFDHILGLLNTHNRLMTMHLESALRKVAETYTPSKLFDGDYQMEVRFGLGTGLDPINQGVMIKQDLGAGLISERTARENHPMVEDPTREENQIAYEMLQKAVFSGLVAGAAAPPGDPNKITVPQLAAIWEELQKPDGDLMTAIKMHAESVPLQQPQQPQMPGSATSPGIAGAGEPAPAFSGPALDQVLA